MKPEMCCVLKVHSGGKQSEHDSSKGLWTGDSEGDNETADCIIYLRELYDRCRAHLTLQSGILVLEDGIFFFLLN